MIYLLGSCFVSKKSNKYRLLFIFVHIRCMNAVPSAPLPPPPPFQFLPKGPPGLRAEGLFTGLYTIFYHAFRVKFVWNRISWHTRQCWNPLFFPPVGLYPQTQSPTLGNSPFVFVSTWLCAHRVIPADLCKWVSRLRIYCIYIKQKNKYWIGTEILGRRHQSERIPPYL